MKPVSEHSPNKQFVFSFVTLTDEWMEFVEGVPFLPYLILSWDQMPFVKQDEKNACQINSFKVCCLI
jgi:hypothetical protein